LLVGVEQEGVNQVAWPGRGLDGPLYEYLGPDGSPALR